MIKAYNDIIILILMSYFIRGLCKEFKEETKVGVEYMQIFRNIPTLFEYFLDALEQRVEILEKNDITTFQERSEDEFKNNEVKREAKYFANRNDPFKVNNAKTDKRNANGQIYDALGYDYTTELHEYGLEIVHDNKLTKEDIFDNTKGPYNKIMKSENLKTELIDKPFNELLSETNQRNVKSVTKEERKKIMKRVKKDAAELGKDFTGVYWSQSNLSPKEVEEKAIKTEQLIEEQNNKNKKK